MLEWYMYALIGSFLWSIVTIIEKKVLKDKHSFEYTITRTFFISCILLFLIPVINLKVDLGILFFIYIISLVATIGIMYKVRAVRHLDISVVAPLTNLEPLFVLIISYFILGDIILFKQFVGIIIIILGAYLLEVNGKLKNSIHSMIKILKSKYTHYILIAIGLFSFESVLNKYLVTSLVEPLVLLFYTWIFIFINFCVISVYNYDGVNQIKKGMKNSAFWIFILSIFIIMASFSLITALKLGNASLVVSIKRMGTIFTTILGGGLFHEKHLKVRLICSLIMLIGAYLVLI